MLSTAVIARSSSAPRLQTYKAEDELNVNGTPSHPPVYLSLSEIKRFWPPLRSLETLHDSIKFEQFDRFLQYLLTSRTPIDSPPKTPLPPYNGEMPATNLTKLCEEVKRLKQLSLQGRD